MISLGSVTSWSPRNCIPWNIKGRLNVRNLQTRRKSVLHRNSIKKRFYCTTNLSALLIYSIILKISEVGATHICFNSTSMWIFDHKCRPDEIFIIPDRIHWCHYSISVSFPGEYSHFYRSIESQEN